MGKQACGNKWSVLLWHFEFDFQREMWKRRPVLSLELRGVVTVKRDKFGRPQHGGGESLRAG